MDTGNSSKTRRSDDYSTLDANTLTETLTLDLRPEVNGGLDRSCPMKSIRPDKDYSKSNDV